MPFTKCLLSCLISLLKLKESQTGIISASESFCSQLCAGGRFYWNYGTGNPYDNYAGDKNCCIYAGFEVVLSVPVAIMQLQISAALCR